MAVVAIVIRHAVMQLSDGGRLWCDECFDVDRRGIASGGVLAERVATGNRRTEDADDECVGLYMWMGCGCECLAKSEEAVGSEGARGCGNHERRTLQVTPDARHVKRSRRFVRTQEEPPIHTSHHTID